MNARKVAVSVSLLLMLGSAVYGDSVSWMPGSTPPKQWSINPANPTPADVIKFTGPTAVYGNSCVGERDLGGSPQLLVDPKVKTVTLWFQGPVPQVCTMIYNPVEGLTGEFGPLPAGDWTFTCPSRDVNFQIQFTVRDKFAYHVDADAPGSVHDGRSWSTAMLTLQDALAAAGSGDQILMAEGTYKPDHGAGATAGSREASFMLKQGLTVRGGYAGYGKPNPDERDLAKHVTILSGDLKGNDKGGLNLGDNSFHVVIGPPDGLPATLEGLTVAGGDANGPYPHHYGGGLYNPDGKVQAVNCTFQGNTGVEGAAVMNFGTSLTLVNCQVVGNHALMQGGGLYNYEGAATLTNCRIVGNIADYGDTNAGGGLYNLNGSLTIFDSTIADNRPQNGGAISSFSWGTAPGFKKVKVVNTILWDGGNEIASNNRDVVDVTYSDVQGGWTGTGNISTDPQFVRPGTWSATIDWGDGDYRLKGTSPAIDAGNSAAVPADSLDLDANGNTTESLPFDLDNGPRVEGPRVDMGAYEQLAQKPTPTPAVTLTVSIGNGFITLSPDPNAPSSSNTFIGNSDINITGINFKGKLSVTVTATSAAGGTWTGGVIPDTVGPNPATVNLWVRGANLNLAALPAGSKNVQVAQATVFIAPI